MREYVARVIEYGRGKQQVHLTEEQIVRCEDCAYFDTRKCRSQWPWTLKGFCSWGKRGVR